MASTPGPLGVSIGKGLSAGVDQLEANRKSLETEEGINQKAQTLYQTAKSELDKYNKMTPYEQASVAARNKEIDQENAPGTTGAKTLTPANMIKIWSDARAANPGKTDDELLPQVQTMVARYRQMLGQAASTAPAAASGPPAGAKFSPSTGKWWTPDGSAYDQTGAKVN